MPGLEAYTTTYGHFNQIVQQFQVFRNIVVFLSLPSVSRIIPPSQMETRHLLNTPCPPLPLEITIVLYVSINLSTPDTSAIVHTGSVSGLFHLAHCLEDLFRLHNVSEFPSL